MKWDEVFYLKMVTEALEMIKEHSEQKKYRVLANKLLQIIKQFKEANNAK